ncbi:alanine/glycine:cation symporter family protein [Pseudovibrio sp. Tun.PSC04-5.I4]|uniref:alanine/glycine:cation symporter family protein n=1 Tax=Pseudovibrio sp. Tun.PSC04-5.I4 TaxID=1798213 RepID=UPI00088DC090|nr:alanine/glycine:cation symporter family protein [Pseudovibrio sp. Tun.PSC04-5.I4]SDR37314.1 alanine or glycine:cation symporter, AGCS family [Pseudovibrio sp. Tun.PSC04-5.I4]
MVDLIVNSVNTVLWNYVLLFGLLAVGIYFTIRLRFLQFIHFWQCFEVLLKSRHEDSHGISPFQALCTSLASRVGTGNIAGVAVALTLGGPGAIFWMWVVALVGMATAYAESTLAQLYKVEDKDGQFRGGPAVYMAAGLKSPLMGHVFAIALIFAFGVVFSAVQSNSIADAMSSAFGMPVMATGAVLVVAAGVVIFGGLRKIAHFAEIVVPFMAGAYVVVAIGILAMNYSEVPGVLWSIVAHALGLEEAIGGISGGVMAAMMNGIRRGLYSNEAGMGSAPNVAASAIPDPHHPASQGFVQALGVFIDTIVICTATALIILLSGIYDPTSGVTGISLTQSAAEAHVGGFGVYFIAVAILFFAFTSIVANYSYAENAMIYLDHGWKPGLTILRLVSLGMVFWGALQTVDTVFNAADAAMGIMATINLIAIVLLAPKVSLITKDYLKQLKEGKEPQFDVSEHPELADGVDATIWSKKRGDEARLRY